MKTLFYLFATSFISFCAFMGALSMSNPFPAFAVAFGIWFLFFWGLYKRMKQAADRKMREEFFSRYMRNQRFR